MRLDIDLWMNGFCKEMKRAFGNRVEFIGLQGSHGRGEATCESDIDVVVILDKLAMEDLKRYEKIIAPMSHRDKICGFLSGKEEIGHWERSDLFQFYHDTVPVYGNLDGLLPAIGEADVRRAVLIGACNIYHMGVHNFLHEKDMGILRSLYKTAFFVLQAKHFHEAGTYVRSKKDLLPLLAPDDGEILGTCLDLIAGNAGKDMFPALSGKIIEWSGALVDSFGRKRKV